MAPTSIKLDPLVLKAIRTTARKRGVSITRVISDAVCVALDVCPACKRDHRKAG